MCEKYPLASLFPLFINWFDLLTGLDTTPESPMLSENHFSRGSFKSHSVWLAKITFFTGPECAGGRGRRRSEVCSCYWEWCLPIRSPAVFITLFLTRLFNRVFVLCLHNSITVIFASNQKWCSHYYCCGVCGSFLSSRQFRSSIHLFDARYKRGSYCWVYWVTRWWLTMEGHGEFPELLRD